MSTFVASTPKKVFKDPIKQAFRSICVAIDSPFSREVSRLDDLTISSLSLDPLKYSSAAAFRHDYLVANYLSKYSGLNTNIDTKAAALTSFEAGELKCAQSNDRFRSRAPSIVDPILYRASRLITQLLGDFSLSKVHDKERWGPGATFEFPRMRAYLDTKISEFPFTVTAQAAPHLIAAIKRDHLWQELLLQGADPVTYDFAQLVEIVPGSRIDTVPKNAKTDRTIAIEPRGNMFLQKAVGSYIRSRLKRVGVDLDDQSINQRLAQRAKADCLATLDLKAASDTICSELIYELLPFDWAWYLDSIRSREFTLDGVQFRKFAKFSSMGNGFTFELESLIFWALTRATCEGQNGESSDMGAERTCAVYGDDIICPQKHAWTLTSVLNYCGFDINLTKSFYEGNFFESCGKHYFDNQDVTPIYQKETLMDEMSAIRAHNRLVRYVLRDMENGYPSDPPLSEIAVKLFERVVDRSCKIPFLPYGADGDDGYLLSDEYILLHFNVRFDPSVGIRCLVRSSRPISIPANEHALYVYQLRVIHARTLSKNLVRDYMDVPWEDILVSTPVTTMCSGYFDSRCEQSNVRSDSYRWVSLG